MSLNLHKDHVFIGVLGLFALLFLLQLEEWIREGLTNKLPQTLKEWCWLFGLCVAVGVLVYLFTRIVEKTTLEKAYKDILANAEATLGQTVTNLDTNVNSVKTSLNGTLDHLSTTVTEFGNLRKLYDRENERIQAWMGDVGKIVNTLEKEVLRDLWLSRPWEYVKFIQSADDGRGEGNARHIDSITLYGTMVGFAFLLPEALRNHACRSQGEFRTLRLIASDATVRMGPEEDDRELMYYPLYLVANLVLELMQNCQHFLDFIVQRGIEFDMQILYLPHDIISAAILLGDREVATLQALDSKTFQDILRGIEPQPGFRYRNDVGRRDAFNRHKTALEDLAKNTAARGRLEKWQFRKHNSSLSLKVTRPHWRNDGGEILFFTREEYDGPKTNDISFEGKENIISGVESLLRQILARAGSGADILYIKQQLLIEAKKKWLTLPPKCPCSSLRPEPIE